MSSSEQAAGKLVAFIVAGEKWALPIAAVERVVRAVKITPCPEAPRAVLGLINVQGSVLPVFDLRLRFGLPPRELALGDQIIIAQSGRRRVALVVEEVCAVVQSTESALVQGEAIPPEAASIDGILKRKGELILISDLERLLTSEEDLQLSPALTLS